MNSNMAYDRSGVAKRIRKRRKELHLTVDDVAEKIGRASHYYGDIERGTCGMSIETLLDISYCLGLSADYILFGNIEKNEMTGSYTAYKILENYDDKTQRQAVELMKCYLELLGQ